MERLEGLLHSRQLMLSDAASVQLRTADQTKQQLSVQLQQLTEMSQREAQLTAQLTEMSQREAQLTAQLQHLDQQVRLIASLLRLELVVQAHTQSLVQQSMQSTAHDAFQMVPLPLKSVA